jgi:hypothetical protein
MQFMRFVFFTLVILGLCSCNNHEGKKAPSRAGIYSDSICFENYERKSEPYLISSCTYSFSDSVNNCFDMMRSAALVEYNSIDRPYGRPLEYSTASDTIEVGILYTPTHGLFHYGKIRQSNDTIFLLHTGSVSRKPKPAKDILNSAGILMTHYYKTVFKIKGKKGVKYTIVYQHSE